MKARRPRTSATEQRDTRRIRRIERLPGPPRRFRIGRFSTGNEQRPEAPGTLRRGSFADGYRA